MNNKVDKNPSNPRWHFLTRVPFKTLITKYVRSIDIDMFGKKNIWYLIKKEKVHQFHIGYMKHPLLKKHRTNVEQVIKMFQSAFRLVTLKCIKNELSKNNVSILLLIFFMRIG